VHGDIRCYGNYGFKKKIKTGVFVFSLQKGWLAQQISFYSGHHEASMVLAAMELIFVFPIIFVERFFNSAGKIIWKKGCPKTW